MSNIMVEDDYEDHVAPPFDMDTLLYAISQDEDIDPTYRAALCEAIIHTEELWIVEVRTFLHGVGGLGVHKQDNYATILPAFPMFVLGSANDLEPMQDLCGVLKKRYSIHIYPKNKPSK